MLDCFAERGRDPKPYATPGGCGRDSVSDDPDIGCDFRKGSQPKAHGCPVWRPNAPPCHTDSCLRGCNCLDRRKNCAAIQRCFWHTAANYAGMRKKRAGDGPCAVKSQNALQSQPHSGTPAQKLLSNGKDERSARARKDADRAG
jgi:hypothetical protein